MIKQLIRFGALAMVAISAFVFTACDEDNALDTNVTEVENYVEDSVYDLHERGNCGKFGCYEFVFPLTITFPDETTATAEDYTGLKDAIKAWKEANPDVTERPALTYPLEVISEDGEIITVENAEDLFELRRACRRDVLSRRGHRWHRHRGEKCFIINFPLTIAYPDGTTEEVENRKALKVAVREWKAANADATERPEVVFPIDVTLEDGTVTSVASKEDLKDLKDSCGAEG